MTFDSVAVDLGARSYQVRIGRGLLGAAGEQIAPLLRRPRVAIVADAAIGIHQPAKQVGALRRRGIFERLRDVARRAAFGVNP